MFHSKQTREFRNSKEAFSGVQSNFTKALTFYITNIPDCKQEVLWRIFRSVGKAINIYIPQKRDRQAGGLASFDSRKVGMLSKWSRNSNKIWTGPNKIQANIARFSRRNREHFIQVSNRETVANTNRLKPSYADIVSRRPCSPNQQVRAVKGNSTNILDSFNLELKLCKTEYEWLNACYTGVVKSMESINNLESELIKEGISNCVVRGNLVLLSAIGNGNMEKIMSDYRGKLVRWFNSLRPWEKQDVGYNRVVWIRCTSIPLHIWSDNFFMNLARHWGECVCIDPNTSEKRRLAVARVAICTSATGVINSSLRIKIDDEIFRISVAEETPCHGGCSNNWWLERDFQPSASLSVNPPTSFVAESKRCERNRNSSGEAANTPAMAMARKPNPHKICHRDVVNAAGINEELQNSSVSERVFDTVRALRDLAHEVGAARIWVVGEAMAETVTAQESVTMGLIRWGWVWLTKEMTTWASFYIPKIIIKKRCPLGRLGLKQN
ncbi:hypothetical protein Ancab_040190 [Ancistrocladus abbreviatus]